MTATTLPVLRAGARRGLIEFANSARNPSDVGFWVFGALVTVVVLWFNRDAPVGDTGISASRYIFPGLLAMQIFIAASWGVAITLSTEREDGTLLRAKALPNGVATYLSGISFRTILETLLAFLIVLVPSAFIVSGLFDRGPIAFAALGILLLGFVALLPLGLVIGAIFRNPRAVSGWGFLVVAAVVVGSGIFFPMINMPLWAQVIGQILPLYWLGLLLRGVLLPENLVVMELGESWRMLEAVGVLGAWAVLGIVLAPMLLRRMARRESGSLLERSRQKALQRV
jgi:ABC-2 type transport system permease protein